MFKKLQKSKITSNKDVDRNIEIIHCSKLDFTEKI